MSGYITPPYYPDITSPATSCFSSGNLSDYYAKNIVKCQQEVSSSLRTGGQYDPDKLGAAQKNINLLFEYSDRIPSSDGKNFRKLIRDNFCNNSQTPGVCDNFLRWQLCSKFTYNDLSDSDNRNFCGCYIKPGENYVKTLGRINHKNDTEKVDPEIEVPCYPQCRRAGAVQLYDSETGRVKECETKNICVIDAITINEINSSVGSVNFNQVCQGCAAGGCECIISASDTTEALKTLGINSAFNQYCGKNSKCYKLNDNDETLTQIKCDNSSTPTQNNSTGKIIKTVLLIGILIIFILVLVAFFSNRSSRIKNNKIATKNRNAVINKQKGGSVNVQR